MEEIQETLASEIRKLRRKLKMDQQTLADIVGITRSSISNIEGGRQSVSLAMFCKIAWALNQDPANLLKMVIDESHIIVSSEDVDDKHVLNFIKESISK